MKVKEKYTWFGKRVSYTLHIFIACLISNLSFGQQVSVSKTYISTYYHGKLCFSLNQGAEIFYDESSHEISLKIDFKSFKAGNDTLDEWLLDLEDTQLLFKANLKPEDWLVPNHHNFKTIVLNGSITFNNITHPHSVEFTLFDVQQGGMLFTEGGQNNYDKVNANLTLNFLPKDFKINTKPHHLRKSILIAVYRGKINLTKP